MKVAVIVIPLCHLGGSLGAMEIAPQLLNTTAFLESLFRVITKKFKLPQYFY